MCLSFRLECSGFNNIRAHVGIFRGMRNIFIQYSYLTCQESAIVPIRSWARSIQPKFPEISVQNSMDRLGPTGKVSKKRVHLLRWTIFPGRTGWNFGWMDRVPWYQSDIINGRHQSKVYRLPCPFFLHPGHALLTSLVDFLFRPAPLKVSIETAVENYCRINNSCHPIRVEWFPDKSMKILKFSNCREIFPLSIIHVVLKFLSSFVLRRGQQW